MEEGNEILCLEWSGAGKRPGHQEGAASVRVTGKAWVKQGLGGHGEGPARQNLD